MFTDAALLPVILEGTRLHLGAWSRCWSRSPAWVVLTRTVIGFEIKVVGQAPAAARLRRLRPQPDDLALPAG